MDEFEILKMVASRLETAGIAYMVTGSIAAAAYGQPRMTRDVDVVIEIEARQAGPMLRLFADDFLVDPDSVHNAIREKSMFNLIHQEAIIKVDFIVRKDSRYRQTEFERRQRTMLSGYSTWIVALEDLILSKLLWAQPSHSETQLRDVRVLIEGGHPLDRSYIERWAAELGIMDLWRELQSA